MSETGEALPPEPDRLDQLVASHAARTPDGEALVLGEMRWSYAELAARIDRLAAALIAAGIGKGDRVATLQTPHPDFVVAFLATASIGAIWVGLNPRYRIEEILHVVEDAEPALLLTRTRIDGRDLAGETGILAARVRTIVFEGDPVLPGTEGMAGFLAHRDPAGLAAARQAVDGDDPCMIVYTSGSTGRPKGAVLGHRGMAGFAIAQNRLWPLGRFRAVNYFPINHIGSVIDCLLPCLAAGGTMIFMESFDPSGCLALMVRERVNLWASVPSVFVLQLGLPDFAGFDLGAVELIVWEGAAMPADLLPLLASVCPLLATNYGMTETGSAITALAPTGDLERLAATVGPAFPGVEVRIADEHGGEARIGVPGEVQVRSPFMMLGYWRNPEANAAAFTPDGFFRTGDLAMRRADGDFAIVGRLKEMFKSGGYNVYPREIEAVLESHPDVVLAAVVAVADPVWQEVGVAYVVAAPGVTSELLAAWCGERLANYKRPKHILLRESLPLLPIGKVDKPALAREARAQFG